MEKTGKDKHADGRDGGQGRSADRERPGSDEERRASKSPGPDPDGTSGGHTASWLMRRSCEESDTAVKTFPERRPRPPWQTGKRHQLTKNDTNSKQGVPNRERGTLPFRL